MYHNKFSGYILGFVLLQAASVVHALESDRDQPIRIDADSVEINERTETSYYTGNVRLVQGSLKISADEVIVYLKQGDLQEIVIKGSPAQLEQIPDNRTEVVKSRARHMQYFANRQTLFLKQDAQVMQGGNLFRGDNIEYDTLTSTVRAKKDAGSKSRVHTIIQPGDKQDAPTP